MALCANPERTTIQARLPEPPTGAAEVEGAPVPAPAPEPSRPAEPRQAEAAMAAGPADAAAMAGPADAAAEVRAVRKIEGALALDMEYARWLEEHNKHINELRAAVNAHAGDNDLRGIVESIMVHYDEIFRLKTVAARADVFHVLSGMWKTPAERCFMWLGQLDQQLAGISNLQQSSQQAKDALSQGMEALQQSLAETLASSGNVANYMGQMTMAMGKLGTLENFLRQVSYAHHAVLSSFLLNLLDTV
ncbi:transcription factor TGAL1-like [Phragmites australis]|uniref:transcription factor TGAL1-like n=1 Tax=Phragmites australis TaxID=29695 RepID=UPI002D797F2A|nr:transcription factor TGAL1-like [Phragmites australis]